MHILAKEREERIRRLVLREGIRDLLLGRLDLGPFADYFQAPEKFYAQGWPGNPADWPPLNERILLPLWEHWDLIYVLDLGSVPHPALRFHVESADTYERVGSIDAGIFDMIELHVWEYGGGSQEVLEAAAFADLVDLPAREGLTVLLDDHLGCTDSEIDAYRESLAKL
jgi:hypothetical protein